MKKIYTLLFLFAIAFNITSCKSEKTKQKTKQTPEKEVKKAAKFSLENAESKVNFTAFKTTEKIAVGGVFKKINITSGGQGNTVKEAINNAEFSIPVSSLFTKDSSRDFKIKKFFFGVMENTKLLSGKLVIENDSTGTASIKMNGVTAKVPFNYTINNNSFSMKATLDIANWKASNALASLNKACLDLHKGTDGVSKTWSEVLIKATSTFK